MDYTKGPWIKEESNLKQEYHFLIASNLQQMWIAKIGNPYDDVEITENNANLIAACPDMYEACLSALGVLNRDPSEIPKMIDSVRGQILQALSKAEGRE